MKKSKFFGGAFLILGMLFGITNQIVIDNDFLNFLTLSLGAISFFISFFFLVKYATESILARIRYWIGKIKGEI
ncbi:MULTISPECIES: hypothetical protein [Lactobacillales]|jgi:hypothetical protein|uniref:hypothetical protein n=1 Tax=Lactobacillales TaxID=186826 RepID=UPI001436B7FE|nr:MULTISPECIES: hypothetical protein [Lactococcus]QIW50523.1 hypothetical protein GU337_00805 [Lactococcus raffinolactis]QPS70800.1 hypothetical protein I6G50_08715 [Lactococcus garvieae]